MDAKEVARRVASAPMVRSPLRWVNANRHLSADVRHDLYLRVTKKVRIAPGSHFRHQVPGRTAITLLLEGSVRELYWTGSYEAETLPLFARYAASASVVLDIGAADGVFSLFAAAANPDARILAFEPGLAQLDRLRRNVAANQELAGQRIRILEAALADEDGTALFHESPSEGDSSLNPQFRAGSVPREVKVARGDHVVQDLLGDATVDLIKIDTESTEPDVLRGLAETIARDRPVIFCEVLALRTEPQLQDLFDGWGYRSWWLGPRGPERRVEIVGDLQHHYVNWLFLPDDREPLSLGPAG